MLEAIRERAQGWIAKVILGLIIVTFAVWGLDSYFMGGGQEPPAAKVNDDEISQREFLRTLKNQEEALKQQLPGKVDEKALRAQVMDQMVNSQLLAQAALKAGFTVLEPQVLAELHGIEIFQDGGKFSQARLDAWARSNGMSEGQLRAMISQDLLLRQVQIGLGEGALAPLPGAARLQTVLAQQREVNEAIFDRKDYLAQVQIDDKAVAADYEAHKADHATPEAARVQFLTLSQAALEEKVQISDDQARKFFEANPNRFQEPDRRSASHILIKIDAGADAKARDAVRAKAEGILAEVKKAPARFAELAKQHSQDPGSGQKGGDLGAFTRDMMVKPFSDAVFSMNKGDISGLVESQFGFHIIRLDNIIPGAKIGFEVAKSDILRELKQQEAQHRFAETAERFSNLVYEQPDSLAPAAKEFGLTIQESPWFERKTAPQPLAHERLLDVLFSQDSISKKQNTEAIETAPNLLVAARILEHRPAGQRPLAEVAAAIRQNLAAARARELAIEAGKKAQAAGEAKWSAPMTLSRMQPLNMPREAVQAVFRANAATLPALVGAETPEGYRVYRITRVTPGEANPEMAKRLRLDLRRMTAQAELNAYLEYLKGKASIKIEPAALEPKVE